MREHFHNLQALRGVACLMVVLAHLQNCEKLFGVQTPVFREIQWFGFAGVDLFFVLSGFIITATNRQQLGRPAAAPGFLFRRVWRIYPMYWVTMVLSAVALYAMIGSGFVTPEVNGWWMWWVTLAPVTTPNHVVAQAWTLTYEMMFYLAFGAVMFLPPRFAWAGLLAWAAAIGIGLFGPEPTGPVAGHLLSPFVLEFLGGCIVAWIVSRRRCFGGLAAFFLGLVYAVAAMLVAHAVFTQSWIEVTARSRIRVLIYGPPAVLFVYGMVSLEGRWPRTVPRWLLRVGDASYSLYLLHPVVLGVSMYVGYKVPHSRVPHLLWLAGSLTACLAVGLLAYQFIERPLLNLAKRRKKPQPQPLRDRGQSSGATGGVKVASAAQTTSTGRQKAPVWPRKLTGRPM